MKKAKKIWSDRKLSMHSNESGKGGWQLNKCKKENLWTDFKRK
jgi:hypothetical protein